MKPRPIAEWSVRWHNPYTKPPKGKRRVLTRMKVDWGPGSDKSPPKKIQELVEKNPGYVANWQPPETVRRTWSEEAVQRNRIRRIEKRAEKKYPLFKDEVVAASIKHYQKVGYLKKPKRKEKS